MTIRVEANDYPDLLRQLPHRVKGDLQITTVKADYGTGKFLYYLLTNVKEGRSWEFKSETALLNRLKKELAK